MTSGSLTHSTKTMLSGAPSGVSLVPEYTAHQEVECVGHPPKGAANDELDVLGTLGQFFRGRPAGQDFGECVKTNITQLTFGTIDLDRISDKAIPAVITVGLAASAIAGTPIRDPVTGVRVSAGTVALLSATAAVGLSGATRAAIVRGGGFLLRGIAIAGAATAGAVIGSSANCAAEGID